MAKQKPRRQLCFGLMTTGKGEYTEKFEEEKSGERERGRQINEAIAIAEEVGRKREEALAPW